MGIGTEGVGEGRAVDVVLSLRSSAGGGSDCGSMA